MARIIKARELTVQPPLWRPSSRVEDRTEPEPPQAISAETPAAPREQAREVDLAAAEAEARQRGLTEGMRAAEEAYRAKLARVESLGERLQAERDEFFDRIEPEVVRLAVAVAEKILAQELELRPEVVVDMIRAAIRRIRDRETLRISVNPRDFEQVRAAREDLTSAIDGVRNLEIVEDRRVGRGGCVIESPNGTLDARVETQIEEIGQTLEGAMPEPPADDDG